MTFAALLLALQVAPLGPLVPAGTNSAFSQAVIAVEEALQSKQFELAAEKAKVLPKRRFRLVVDDQGVPAGDRAAYGQAVQNAAKAWNQASEEIAVEVATSGKGDIRLSFSKDLGTGPEGLPLGGAILPGDVPFEAVISTVRGDPPLPALPSEVRNEAIYAIASYLGLDRSSKNGFANSRTDFPTTGSIVVNQMNVEFAMKLQGVVDTLRTAIREKTPLAVSKPRLMVDASQTIMLASGKQGDGINGEIPITNNGNSPLNLRAEPECGCYAVYVPAYIQPGKTEMLKVFVNTAEFTGKLRKKVRLVSNDPDFPHRELIIGADVEPLFRLIHTDPPILQMSDKGLETAMYMILAEGGPGITAARVDGLPGQVTFEPWQGDLADPESGEGVLPRKGYRLKIKMDASPVYGRATCTVAVTTEAPLGPLRIIRKSFLVQKGVVALPEVLFWGDIANKPTAAGFIVSRPGKPFKVKSIVVDLPHFTAVVRNLKDGSEYRVDVSYDGQGQQGLIEGMVKVLTDDPAQPEILVRMRGSIQ